MTEIKKPMALIAESMWQGVQLKEIEAEILLGYIEGHDYCLLCDDEHRLWMHDIQDGDGDDTPFTMRDVVEFCSQMNNELLVDESGSDEPNEDYLLELRKDELILDGLLDRVHELIPPVVRQWRVCITEFLRKTVTVEAASWAEARMKVEADWKAGEYVLTADDFAGVDFVTS